MTDAPPPPPGWEPPAPPTAPSPAGDPPPPPPSAPPGWAAPMAPPAPATPGWAAPTAPPGPPPPGWAAPTGPPGPLPPPPGTPGYGYGHTPTGAAGTARSLGGIATALAILLVLTGLAALGVSGALVNRAAVLDGADFDFADVEDADDLAAATGAVYLLLFVATVVLWMIWQFRHAKNAEVLGKRNGLGAGWAIGGWFIPLANLVLGPLELHQSARASDPDAPPGRGRAPAVVALWWALWAAQGVVGLFSGRLGFTGDLGDDVDLEEFRSSDQLGAAGALITAAAAFVAVAMVRRLTARQRRALADRGVPG